MHGGEDAHCHLRAHFLYYRYHNCACLLQNKFAFECEASWRSGRVCWLLPEHIIVLFGGCSFSCWSVTAVCVCVLVMLIFKGENEPLWRYRWH